MPKKQKLIIEKSIVPIVAENNGKKLFLGTGFFLEANHKLITAYHVIKDIEKIGIFDFDGIHKFVPANIYKLDKEADLVLLAVEGFIPDWYFKLQENDDYYLNKFVICCEYGTTKTLGQTIEFSYATRIGNITRTISNLEILGKAGESALELSFPALMGSSGAPILMKDTMKVLGIMVKNVQYDLLPVQIEQTHDINGKLCEEIKYMMPQGIAINVKHIRNFISK